VIIGRYRTPFATATCGIARSTMPAGSTAARLSRLGGI
jgi:hypothetical protein